MTVMHDLRLIHTDLKPENILLVSSECIKVPDYKVIPYATNLHEFPCVVWMTSIFGQLCLKLLISPMLIFKYKSFLFKL